MALSGLVWLGGLSAVVGGALLVVAELWGLLMELIEGLGGGQPFSETTTTASLVLTSGMYLLAAVLLLFGLVGLHLRHAERSGVLGLVGFLLAFLGTALAVGVAWTRLFVAPSLAEEVSEFLDAEQVAGPLDTGFILSLAVLAVGWALFGVGALVARSYPRCVAIVLIVAALIQFLPFPGSRLIFGVAVALFGYFSLAGGRMPAERHSLVV